MMDEMCVASEEIIPSLRTRRAGRAVNGAAELPQPCFP